jgi:hypothetical protein
MLKQFSKFITLTPTRFGSRKNHHQGAVLCLAKTTEYGFSVLVGVDTVTVMVAYQPVVQACGELHTCTTGQYAAITLTASIPTSTEKPYFIVLAKHSTAPDDGPCVNRNTSEQVL